MSHPDGLPDLLLDRSLGRIKVPALLRQAGLRLVTLAEHYGVPADETARRFLVSLAAIEQAVVEGEAAVIYAVHQQRIERLLPAAE